MGKKRKKEGAHAMTKKEEEQLRSTINTPEVEDEITAAFENSDRSADADLSTLSADFEHGQWWMVTRSTLWPTSTC